MHRRTAGRPVLRTVLNESDTERRTNPISLAYRAQHSPRWFQVIPVSFNLNAKVSAVRKLDAKASFAYVQAK
jgi:hypothetical protein